MIRTIGVLLCVTGIGLGWQQTTHSRWAPNAQSVSNSEFNSPALDTIRIEDIRVGMRVAAFNPEISNAERAAYVEPNWSTWVTIQAKAIKPDGSQLLTEFLAPPSEGRRLKVGDSINVATREIEIEPGSATVLSIGPAPPIACGLGKVVVSTFKHTPKQIVDIRIEGSDQSIGTTPNHPFWDVTKNDFVRADDLTAGSLVRTADKKVHSVQSVDARTLAEPVYNFEVHFEHVYFVGTKHVLVHNNDRDCDGGKKLTAKQRRERDRAREDARQNDPETPDLHDKNKVVDDITKSEQNLENALEQARRDPSAENLKALQDAQDQVDSIKDVHDSLNRRNRGGE